MTATTRLGFAVVTMLLVPGAFLAGLLLAAATRGNGRAATPVVVAVRETPYDERRGVQLTPTWAEGPDLFAPAWAGIVGSVTDADVLQSGDRIAVIDGIARLAFATDQPFFRSLALGDTGRDVEALHELLQTRGLLRIDAGNGMVTPATMDAVTTLAGELGVPGPTQAFDPAWIVWLAADPFPVASIEMEAGQLAPSAGSVIATSPPNLAAVAIQPLDGVPLDVSSTDSYVLAVRGAEFDLQAGLALDRAALDRLSALIGVADETVEGSIYRSQPRLVWTVPTTAVSSGPGGELCVWVEEGVGYEATPVTLVSSQAGVTYLEPRGTTVMLLTNPAEVLDEPSCPSG